MTKVFLLAAVICGALGLVGAGCSSSEATTTSVATQTTTSLASQRTDSTEMSEAEMDALLARMAARDSLELYRTVTGTGDQEGIDLPTHANTPLLLHFTGKGEEGNEFVVMGVDYTNGYVSIMGGGGVGEIEGYSPLDWYDGADTFELSVNSAGPWTLEIKSIDDIPTVTAPKKILGYSSEVVRIVGSPSSLDIKGDGTGREFKVVMYSSSGEESIADSDTTFHKRVDLPGGPVVLFITAYTDWSITVD